MEEEMVCSTCRHCNELNEDGYEGWCRSLEIYLKTIDDRTCEKWSE